MPPAQTSPQGQANEHSQDNSDTSHLGSLLGLSIPTLFSFKIKQAYLSASTIKILWFPKELHHGIDIRFVLHVFKSNHPGVPIEIAIGFCAREVDRIEAF